MKQETFFEKFDLFVDTPDAVAKMRRLVRNLAVQGKLVPQDPNDDPAEELLEHVKAAREALVVERRVRKSDEVEYSLYDEATDAPAGWLGVHVHDVAIIQGGKRLPNGAAFSDSPTPHVYIRVTDMKNGTISETGLRYISPDVQREIARYIINKEDLYITIAGTIGQVGCVPESLDGHNLTENAAKIVFRGFDRRFFQLTLTSDFVQAQFLDKTKQMAQPKLALKRIAGAKFYLPPLAEQKRIVAKVDELMALCDRLEAQQQERETRHAALARASLARFADAPTSANLQFIFHPSYPIHPADLRQAILTLAVQGKLVAQDPNDEPACLLRSSILAARDKLAKEGRATAFPTNTELTEEGLQHSLPTNWEWIRLGELGVFVGGGTPSKERTDYWDGPIPWVSPKDMKRPYIEDAIDHVSQTGLENSSGKMIPKGSLLMVVRGMILAHSFPVALNMRELTINQDMKALQLALPDVGEYLLRCCAARKQQMLALVERSSHGTCRLPTEAVANFLIPLPPLAEQRRIVKKLDELMSLCNMLEAKLAQAKSTSSELLSAAIRNLLSASTSHPAKG